MGVDIDKKSPDLSKVEFQKLQEKVEVLANSPDQKQPVEVKEAADCYSGTSAIVILALL